MNFHRTFAAILFFAGATAAAAQDRVGIDICDAFLAKYQACMQKQAGAQRDQVSQMLDQLRASWKQMAGDPQFRGGLTQACERSTEQVKETLNVEPFNCGF